MRLKNHIAYRFLTDDGFLVEGMEMMHGKDWMNYVKTEPERIATTYDLLSFRPMKHPNLTYYITDSVIHKLDMLHVKRTDGKYDWTVFTEIKPCKKTFIFNGNKLLRMIAYADIIYFLDLSFTFDGKVPGLSGEAYYIYFYVNRVTGEQCDHFNHPDVKNIETFIYRLLCFIFLSENTEEVILPGRKTGTQKSGKFVNEFPDIPVIMVTSKWKVKVIRTDSFPVSGHFRLQPYGPLLSKKKMIFIDPFEKQGYKREY